MGGCGDLLALQTSFTDKVLCLLHSPPASLEWPASPPQCQYAEPKMGAVTLLGGQNSRPFSQLSAILPPQSIFLYFIDSWAVGQWPGNLG